MKSNFIVVANSTPIILLQKIGHIDLLKNLYSKVYIAEAVYREIIIDGSHKIDSNDFISQNDWIEIVTVKNTAAQTIFSTNLHAGEVETMLIAMELQANLCILDDLLARKYAKNFNLDITGTLGVIIASKNKGNIKEVKPLLNELRDVGMYIKDDLYLNILSIANEH